MSRVKLGGISPSLVWHAPEHIRVTRPSAHAMGVRIVAIVSRDSHALRNLRDVPHANGHLQYNSPRGLSRF